MSSRGKSLLDPADSHWDRQVTLDVKSKPYTYTHFNRDDLRRLVRGTRMLEHLLKRSAKEDLPALTWTVTTSGSLVGELTTIGGPDPAGCREAFMAWVQALELDHLTDDKLTAPGWWKERRHDDKVELTGARHMPARAPESHLNVSISVRAYWWTYDEERAAERETEAAQGAAEYDAQASFDAGQSAEMAEADRLQDEPCGPYEHTGAYRPAPAKDES